MARRRRTITREDLLHRYARVKGLTFGEAHDLHHGTAINDLRDLVESAEEQPTQSIEKARADFRASLQTTTVEGETR